MDNIYSRIRRKYGLSRIGMSKVMGFGVNQWGLYEDGKVKPVESHWVSISHVKDPKVLKVFLEDNELLLRGELGRGKYDKVIKKVEELIRIGEKKGKDAYKEYVMHLYDDERAI